MPCTPLSVGPVFCCEPAHVGLQLTRVPLSLQHVDNITIRVKTLEAAVQGLWSMLGVDSAAAAAGASQLSAAAASSSRAASPTPAAAGPGSRSSGGGARASPSPQPSASGQASALDHLTCRVQELEQQLSKLKRGQVLPTSMSAGAAEISAAVEPVGTDAGAASPGAAGGAQAAPAGMASSSTGAAAAQAAADWEDGGAGGLEAHPSMLDAASNHLGLTRDLAGQLQQLQDRVALLEEGRLLGGSRAEQGYGLGPAAGAGPGRDTAELADQVAELQVAVQQKVGGGS